MNRGLPRLRCTAAGQTRCRRFGPDLLDRPRPTTLDERLLQRDFPRRSLVPVCRQRRVLGPNPVRDRDRIGDLASVRHLGRARPSSRELASLGSIVMAVTWPGFGQSAEATSIAKLEMRLVRRIRTQGRGIAGVRDGAITCDIGMTGRGVNRPRGGLS